MSRLSPERVQIALSPHQVAMVRMARGWKRLRVTNRGLMPCAQTGEPPNWGVALETLRAMLAPPHPARAPATVILSNHFMRYLVLPWSAELVTHAEELEFTRARFAQVFGDKAHQWAIRTGDAPAGAQRLAAATDLALIEALTRTLGAAGLTLVSCQPALMAQFNASRSRVGDSAWLVGAERGRLLVAWIHKGHWRSVRILPLTGACVPLRDLLEQERMLVSAGEPGHKVFVSAADGIAIDSQGLRPEVFGARSSSRAETQADAPYAAAMAGMH